MDRLYVDSFHNVHFSELPVRVSKWKLPSDEFYTALYSEIDRRNVPVDAGFVRNKRQTADMLKPYLSGRVLSWGAGLGIVESALADGGLDVTGVEVKKPKGWNDAVKYAGHISDVSGVFDSALEVSTFYTMRDKELRVLLSAIADRVRPGGTFVAFEQDGPSLAHAVRGVISTFLVQPFKPHHAFWGYLRTPAHLICLASERFEHVESHYYAIDDALSFSEVPNPARLFGRQVFGRNSRAQWHVFRRSGK